MRKSPITGAHAVIYSREAERDRAFLRDVLQFPSVDAGGGWLIFALPPAELAIHPADANDRHELYLMTADVVSFIALMAERGVECSPPQSLGWGVLTSMTLPGGGKLGVYEPRHAQPVPARSVRRTARASRRPAHETVKRKRKR